ncbi:hypothetical protein [Cohnella sp. GCM10027633]|uniref:hypothetical protein n=1 Tax=unclassified Cohnella TaxID=2636738 RepID=UPI003644D22E
MSYIIIDRSLLEHRAQLSTYLLISFVVALALEVFRNRWLNADFRMTKARWIVYAAGNAAIGIPLITVKPSEWKGILLLIGSVAIMAASSTIFGVIMAFTV